MRIVYVAGPFTAETREGVEANIKRAVELSLEVARLGAMPLCPHANTAHPDFESIQPYEFWIGGTAELLRRSDAVIFTSDYELSGGARSEQQLAMDLGIPRFYRTEDLAEWLK